MKDSHLKRVLLKVYYGLYDTRYKIFKKTSLLLYRHSSYYQSDKKNLEQLRNSCANKRAFIICNGPSLKAEDLDKIYQNHEISFACNEISAIFKKTKWRPDFHIQANELIADEHVFRKMQEAEGKWKFFRNDTFWQTRKIIGNNIFLNIDGNRQYLENPKFSEDAREVLYAIGTSTYLMIQLAVFMGIREMYIIGCDNQYNKTRTKDGQIIINNTPDHFSEDYDKPGRDVAESTWEMDVAYEYARKYADEHGIKIYNATRGGKLEAFERVDFDSLFPIEHQK